ncbi:translation elongation factor Ts [Dethiosulfovibrio peptidovorans DSM 11002]|uniref:Elongation factor Ts n=1 Tax=Dethiosulfovibrio peptidovorans DSM 11002 TaxID=469381 RepID=D2Z4T2_9BACT|nr:translation elongation factor Ts [Dethiosulfovibrio peptidovorans]EFC92426.1 translation elongation factor Ts [Dethiosulfovibrio peptidovorans DSM 11002]
MAISASDVKSLRERTGCGMMDCKNALAECEGNVEKAVDYLREKGLAKAAKKASRAAKEGRVFSYIHTTGKIGVLLELDCETDFVAKTDEFQELGHEIAMHVAAAAPIYVSPEEVPSEELNREIEVYRQQALQEGKPENILDKIAEGRVRKYYETVCLMEQPWIRDGDKKIKDLVIEAVAKLGENMVVRRFARFSIGE